MKDTIEIKGYFERSDFDLVAFEKRHVEMVAKWMNDERINISIGARFPVSEYEQMMWYENICKDKTKRKLIISTKNKEHIGMVSLFDINRENQELWN